MFRLLMLTLGAIVTMMVAARGITSQSASPDEGAHLAEAVSSPKPHLRPPASSDATEIKRDASGQFHLTALVNGENTEFLIDTGADLVTLTIEEAERLGIEIDQDSFRPIARTASGIGYGTRIHIDQLAVAGQEFEDVEALIVKGLDVNLLGQSVLRRMGQVELRGDTMIIRSSI